MSIFQNFFAKRRLAKAQLDAAELANSIAPFLNATGQTALHDLKRSIPFWSLTNGSLRKYLGYVAGVIDAGQQSVLGKTSADDWTATELVFHQVIEAQLDWILGCDSFLEVNRLSLEAGGTAIGGMQRLADFNEAMKLGASDFLLAGSPGFFPKGLYNLGLFLSVQDGTEHNESKEPVPAEYLSEVNIFDSSQDHKLSDTGFFRRKCLAEIYGNCIAKGRNILPSDFVTINRAHIDVQEGPGESNTGNSLDEMNMTIIVSCSEPIIARCLTTSVELDFENCTAVVDNITKYLVFSRGRDEALSLFRLMRMENLVWGPLSGEQEMRDYFLAIGKLEQRVLKVMASAKSIDMQTVERIEAEGL